MTVLLIAIALIAASGLAALLAGNLPRLATLLGAGGTVMGCAIGLGPVGWGLLHPGASRPRSQ